MRIVLHEAPNAGQTGKRTRRLVPMHNPEFCHSDRQLFVAPVSSVKDEAVTGTVHWLQCPRLLFDVEREHVFFVVLPMTRRLPQLRVVHVGRDDSL
jgi:hypothetical protein